MRGQVYPVLKQKHDQSKAEKHPTPYTKHAIPDPTCNQSRNNSVCFISIPPFLLIQQICPLILTLPIPPLGGNEGNLNLLCQTRPHGTNPVILTNLLPSQVFKFWTCRSVYVIYPASSSAPALSTCSSWVLG